MRLGRIIAHRLRSLLRRRRVEDDLELEIKIHLDQLTKELVANGMNEREARLEARRQFGAPVATKEECRDRRRVNLVEDFIRDTTVALRSFRRSPGFALTAVISLALGVGVNTVVFSVMNALLLRSLPVADPTSIQSINNRGRPSISFPAYREIRDRNKVFDSVIAYRITHMALSSGPGGATRVFGYLVTGNYFTALGVKPALGRFFTQQEDLHPNASPYAVLSYDCWRNHFAGDPTIAGRDILIDGRSYRVLGVAPPEFHGTEVFYWPQIWLPMMMQPVIEGKSSLECRGCGNMFSAARLKKGVWIEQAEANLGTITAQLVREDRIYEGMKLTLSPPGIAGSMGRAPMRAFLGGVMVLALLVLLAACSNLAALQIARGLDRERDLGIRLSIGATRGRLVRQLATESIVLSLLAGTAGVTIAVLLLRLISRWRAPLEFPVQFDVTADWRVFIAAFLAALITGLLLGCGLARRAWNTDPALTMKGAARAAAGRRWAAHDLLLPIQIALCCVLVTASLVAMRGLLASLQGPLGYRPDGVAVASFDVGFSGYDDARGRAFQKRALDELARLPGVESAAYSSSVPLSIDQSSTQVFPEDTVDFSNKNSFNPTYYDVSPGYFHTIGTRLLEGREFTPRDDQGSPAVAIVNERFARRVLGTPNAVGRRFRYLRTKLVTVVGVVEDGKYETLTEAPKLVVYWPILQQSSSNVVLLARSSRPVGDVAGEERQMVARLDPGMAVYSVGGLRQMLGLVYLPMRAAAIMLGAFGILALMLAVTGIYGLSAYTVSRRSREIGIRVAIGARPAQVLQFVFGRLGTLVIGGAILGLALGLAGASVLASIVYEATARDPVVIVSAIACIVVVSLAAGLSPARRCLSIDPVNSLRQD